jgi:hypothetical protein
VLHGSGYGGHVNFGAVKKEAPKGQKYFSAYSFFFCPRKLSTSLVLPGGAKCEAYMNVFRWKVFSIVLILYSV